MERSSVNRKLDRLLKSLRDAIDEAIADSPTVAAVMAELERAGISPSLLVDVAVPKVQEPALNEVVRQDGPLQLTACDEELLRDMGIGKQA